MKTRFADASPLQKAVAARLMSYLLVKINCASNYRIEESESGLVVRESLRNSPPLRRKERLEQLMRFLTRFFKVVEGSIVAQVTSGGMYSRIITVPRYKIVEMDLDFVNHFIPHRDVIIERPTDIDAVTWSQLPKEVVDHWESFSKALQAHLIRCAEVGLANALEHASDTAIGVSFLSPIGLAAPSYPVRLPAPAGFGGAADRRAEATKVYDVSELLRVRANADRTRPHPLTRVPYHLSDILPAPDALEALMQRAAPAEEEVPVAAMGGLAI